MNVKTGSSVAGDSATSAIWTLLSRISGFGRVVLIGAVLGPSYFGNLFQLANQLPWLAFDLAIGALLGSLLVPALVRHVTNEDPESVARVAGGFLGLIVLLFSGIVAIVLLLLGPIAELFALPIVDPATRQQFVSTAGPLLALTAPQLIGYGVAITGQATQHAMGYYKIPAAASIAENVVVIATLAVFGIVFGTGIELEQVTTSHVLLLGGGSSLGVALHAGIQLWGVSRLGVRLRPRAGWNDPDVRQLVRQAIPTSGTAFLNGTRLLMLLTISNTVPGGVVAFQLALNVLNVPVALGAKPVVHALLPRLSGAYQKDDMAEFSDRYLRGVGFAFLLTLPAAMAVASLGWLLSVGVAVGEMDSDAGRQLLAFGITGVAGAIIGDGLYHLATAASYSSSDMAGPLRAQIIRVGLTLLGSAAAMLFSGPEVVLCLAVSMSMADLLSGLYLHRRMRSKLIAGEYGLVHSLSRSAGCAFASFGLAGLVGYAASLLVDPLSVVNALIISSFAVLVGLAGFVAVRSRLDNEMRGLIDEALGRVQTVSTKAAI